MGGGFMAKQKPWERRKGESDAAYAAFLAYRDMGSRRSLERLAEATEEGPDGGDRKCIESVSLSALRKFCNRWDWVERCRTWDNHLQAQRDREAAKETARVERRRRQWLDRMYENALAMDERARAMAKFPVRRQRVEKEGDKTVTIIEPGARIGLEIASLHMRAHELAMAYFDAHEKSAAVMSEEELEAVTDPDAWLAGEPS
jgi:hypothetical protein